MSFPFTHTPLRIASRQVPCRNAAHTHRSHETPTHSKNQLNRCLHSVRHGLWVEASLSIEHPLRTPPPDKPWARPTRTRVRTVHSAILRLAGVLHGHNLLRAPHKHLQRLCKIWSLVRRITSEVAAAGAAATVSSLSLSGMPIQCG